MLADYLNQKATYWVGQPDGFGGYTWSSPTVIDVRWQEKTEKTKDQQGEEVVSKSQVYCMENLDYGTMLYKGETTETNPDNVEAYEVLNKKSRVDMEGQNDGYKVWL